MPTLERVLEKYPEDANYYVKNFPLRGHKMALPAALANLAAGRQGQYWPYHELVMANYNKLTDDRLTEFAQQVGLDMTQYDKDRKDPALQQLVTRDFNEGRASGVRGTPTVFVNGRLMQQRSAEALGAAVEQELKSRGK